MSHCSTFIYGVIVILRNFRNKIKMWIQKYISFQRIIYCLGPVILHNFGNKIKSVNSNIYFILKINLLSRVVGLFMRKSNISHFEYVASQNCHFEDGLAKLPPNPFTPWLPCCFLSFVVLFSIHRHQKRPILHLRLFGYKNAKLMKITFPKLPCLM